MEEKLSKANIEVGVVPASTGKSYPQPVFPMPHDSRFRCYTAEELEDVIARLCQAQQSSALV